MAAAVAVAVAVVVAGAVLVRAGLRAASPSVAWRFSPAANVLTVSMEAGHGPLASWVLGRSHLAVAGPGAAGAVDRRGSAGGAGAPAGGGGQVDVRLAPGHTAHLVARVTGPRPVRRVIAVDVPPPLSVTGRTLGPRDLVLSLSAPVRHPAAELVCGRDQLTWPTPTEAVVGRGVRACRSTSTITATDGERAAVTLDVPALPEVPLYSFASPAHRSVYITVDDGWTPSPQVLALMRRTHLPVTAFLIEDAIDADPAYWHAFVSAGGRVEDHTVSHPYLTRLGLGQATAQWAGARQADGTLFGSLPSLGRAPYGAVDAMVRAAAYGAGLRAMVGWSVTVDQHGIRTWDHGPLEPGEIVLLHWVTGLGGQLTHLLAAVRAAHLVPAPLTTGSFAGVHPDDHPSQGD
ncbi:MAG: polysaccharide deacetylase family protein [Acidimicrobiales bacterium]